MGYWCCVDTLTVGTGTDFGRFHLAVLGSWIWSKRPVRAFRCGDESNIPFWPATAVTARIRALYRDFSATSDGCFRYPSGSSVLFSNWR